MKTRRQSVYLIWVLSLGVILVFTAWVSAVAAREPGMDLELAAVRQVADPSTSPPSLPFNPYGTVKVNGENAEVGTLVAGWCGGTQWDTYPVELASNETWYSLEIPADDPNTGEVEGCAPGDPVTFTLGGLSVVQSTTWQEGADERVDLSTTFGVTVVKRFSDGAAWYDADTPSSYPELTEGEDLTWRIAITNTSDITVTMTVTDTLDGSPLDLSTLCIPEPPSTLSPGGGAGASYVCDISGSAIPGTHHNLITATIVYEALDAMAYDRAGYVGIKDETFVYLPLVLR
jgi:hypothetical protein